MVKCHNIDIFSETLLYVFDFLREIEANTLQHLDHVMGFKKDIPGISRGLDILIFEGLSIFQKFYNEFLLYLPGGRGQHCATSDPGMGFQKNTPGISRGLNIQVCVFSIFYRNATINFLDFVHDGTG